MCMAAGGCQNSCSTLWVSSAIVSTPKSCIRDSSRGKRNAKADSRVSIGELMTYEFCSVPSTGLSGNNYVLFRVKIRWFLKSKTFRRHRNCYLTLRFDPPNACSAVDRKRVAENFRRPAELHSADRTERLTRMLLKTRMRGRTWSRL